MDKNYKKIFLKILYILVIFILFIILKNLIKYDINRRNIIYSNIISKEITNIIWEFGIINGPVWTRNFIFGNDGLIKGYSHPNEYRWEFVSNIFKIYNQNGNITRKFTVFCKFRNKWRMYDDESGHILTQVDKIDKNLFKDYDYSNEINEINKNNIYKFSLFIIIIFLILLFFDIPQKIKNYFRKYDLYSLFKEDKTLKEKINLIFINYGLFLFLILYTIIWLFFIDFVPIWDGYLYYQVLKEAVIRPFNITNFNAFGHPSMGYFLFLSILQYLDPGNHILLNLSNLILLIISIILFYKLLIKLFGENYKKEIILFTFCYSFCPLLYGTSLNLNLDYAVAIFFIISLYFLISKNYLFYCLFSILLLFSKESGIVLYLLLFISTLFYYILYNLINIFIVKKDSINDILNKKLSLKEILVYLFKFISFIIPLIILLLYFFYKKYILKQGLLWAWERRSFFKILVDTAFNLDEKIFKTRIIQIFILNFNWILTTFLIVFFILFIVKIVKNKIQINNISNNTFGKFDYKSIHFKYILISSIVFIIFSYLQAAYKTFTNSRYILPAIPLLFIFSFYAIIKILNKKFRIITLSVLSILLFFQTYFTIDPLSILLFKTFRIGNQWMLRMTSITKEYIGYAGRDQILYNAQYIFLEKLVNKIFKTVDYSNKFIINSYADFFIFTPVDNKKLKRTSLELNVFEPEIITINDINRINSGEKAYYINLPWMEILRKELKIIYPYFDIINTYKVNYNLYSINCYELIKR